mgnify:CR=1 FL=1
MLPRLVVLLSCHIFIATSTVVELSLACDLIVARMLEHSHSSYEVGH